MSAESPNRSRIGDPMLVPPQHPSGPTLMDTVSGLFNDVTLNTGPTADPKDVIQWARFENADFNETKWESNGDGDIQPLLLIIGYGAGIQVWVIQPGGEAQEALSWRHGSVRVAKFLPTPTYGDNYTLKRPLMAIVDTSTPGPHFCSVSYVSLTGGDQVKSVKFKNPILDVVANKRSVVVSFAERLAVFDACKFEERLTVTTCYPCPCPSGVIPSNPISLGDRWLAYAERRLSPNKKSSGGCEGEGVASYAATVLHAAKSLGKGLRGLGESVASSLGGTRSGVLSQSPSPPHAELQPGVVTIIDLENFRMNDEENQSSGDSVTSQAIDSVIAHFVAHSEPIVAMKFDASGMILLTADKRGHDFHVFRIHPHPSGSDLASVHHLYILHRGDTTAKVQDINISFDCRWVAVSTLRGTTHVFPITPYGGTVGVRTHASPHVVNRLSRFQRSAGLAADGRSSSPVGENVVSATWYPNPRLPPFPVPCNILPLARLRPVPINGVASTIPTHTITRNSSGRQRLSSLSEEGQLPLAVCAKWQAVAGVTRSRGLPTPPATQALYVMSAHGNLVQYHIHPKHVSGIPKEKVCDDTPIELEVETKAQWPLQRPATSVDIMAPLPLHHILINHVCPKKNTSEKVFVDAEDRWPSQVEIMTHAGPHRRLWMGPQFVFKTYNAASGTSLSLLDSDAIEVGTGPTVARSNPVNMPGARSIVPVLIESGSASSLEHSPRLSDAYRKGRDGIASMRDSDSDCHREGEVRLKEDLAEAMRDTEQGCEWTVGSWSKEEDCRAPHVHRIVNPLGTVVSGASSSSPSPPSEADSYILSNEDEALFRPVVRAPRSMPANDTMPTRPLSSHTLLPAQHVSHPADTSPSVTSAPAASLTDNVVIPAKLSQRIATSTQSVNSGNITPGEDTPFPPKTVDQMSLKSTKPYENKKPDSKKKSISKKQSNVSQKKQDNLNGLEIDLPKNANITDVSQDMVPFKTNIEFSKASDKIQYCNNELVGNLECEQNIHITVKSSKVYTEHTNLKYNTNIAKICKFEDKVLQSCEAERHFSKIEQNFQGNLDDEFVFESFELYHNKQPNPIKSQTKICSKQIKGTIVHKDYMQLNQSENLEEPWEVLSDANKNICKITECDDVPSEDYHLVSETDVNTNANKIDENKSKLKKSRNKKIKSRTALRCPSPVKLVVSEPDVVEEPKLLPTSGVSWSKIASVPQKIDKIIDLSPKFDSILNDEFMDKKETCIYNRSNIVLASCDTPQTYNDSFADEPMNILDDNDFDDYAPSSKIDDDSKIVLDDDDVLINEVESVKQVNNDDKNKFSDDKNKFSDEENVSPISSQGESDDGTQLMSLDEKCKDPEDMQANEFPLITLNPTVVNKANKKKPKRKRR